MAILIHNAPLNKIIIAKLVVTYRKVIAQNLQCILNGRVLYLEPVTVSTNFICHIVVPLSLRRFVFNLMHASPISDCTGEYKTFYRLKIRFF